MTQSFNHQFRPKLDLPDFDGTMHLEDFLDWLVLVERYFEGIEGPVEK